mgnify:CR=1 FL=1
MGEKWTLESAAREKAPGLHPFAGARFRVFLRHAILTPGLDPRTRFQRFIAWCLQIVRFLPTIIEQVRFNGAIDREVLTKPPIFVIGHWRSGTTHLHNLMCRDPQFGFLKFSETAMPLDMLGPKVRIARWVIDLALPKTRGYDNVKLALDEPQEEEMALGNLNPIGYYSIYYLPQDMDGHRDRALFFKGVSAAALKRFRKNYEFLIRKVSYVKGGRQLLFKNPPSTTRMEMILEMHPDAKFIHIVRNPWPVFCSSCGKFPRLFNAFAWQPFQHVDIPGYTLDTYEKLMRRYLADREKLQLPANQLVETTYEKITEDPLGEIGRIYDQLGLDGKEAGLKEIATYVGSVKDYDRNVHRITPEHADAIRERWRFSFEEWGYDLEPPGDIAIAPVGDE